MHVSHTFKNYLNWIALAGVLLHFLVLHQGGISNWIACQHGNGSVQIENMDQHQAYHHHINAHTHQGESEPSHQHEAPSSHPENSVSQNKNQEVKDLDLHCLQLSLVFQSAWIKSLYDLNRVKLAYQPQTPEQPPPWSYPVLKQSTILII